MVDQNTLSGGHGGFGRSLRGEGLHLPGPGWMQITSTAFGMLCSRELLPVSLGRTHFCSKTWVGDEGAGKLIEVVITPLFGQAGN
jgi:hypothetical protein